MAKAKRTEATGEGYPEHIGEVYGQVDGTGDDRDTNPHINEEGDENFGEESSGRRRRTPEEFRQEYGYYLKDETKSQKFTRVAARRVSAVIDALRTLPQLGAKQTYECTAEQADKMWDAIHEEFKKNVAEFERVQVGGYSAREKSFTF